MRPIPRLLTLLACVLACTTSSALAASIDDVPSRPMTTTLDDGGDRSDVALAPARFDPQRVDPGTTVRLALEIRNYTDAPISFRSLVLPLKGSDDPGSFVTPAERDSRAAQAVEWVEMPFDRWPQLAPSTQLRFPVTIRVPDDARPGAYALGLGVSQKINTPAIGGVESNEARVVVDANLASQLVLRVSGDAVADLRVRNVDAPRFVWGGDTATFRADAFNEGDTLLDVDAQVELNAFLGTAGRVLDTDAQELLPGGRRRVELRWSDTPLIGWFQPKLVVVGGDGSGERSEQTLDTVWVIPPWWLLLAIAFATWLPIRSIRRRRRLVRASGADRARARSRVQSRQARRRAKERAAQARRRR